MKLIEPTTEYCRQIRAYRKEFLDCGDSMDGTHGLTLKPEYGAYELFITSLALSIKRV